MQNRIGISFMNTMGNLIFLSSAVKVLRNWGVKNIDLITDLDTADLFQQKRSDILKDLGSKIFDKIIENKDVKINEYKKIYSTKWSQLPHPRGCKKYDNIIWMKRGIHEVTLYLSMIGATLDDFDGYIFPITENPELPKTEKTRIALANASGSEQARLKSWNKFPELSESLIEIGFEVILVGLENELEGCKSTYDFRGKLSIYETARVIQQCQITIASSTGLAVISDVVKTPVVMIEGPIPSFKGCPLQADYEIVRKYISCAPCFQSQFWKLCNKADCMNLIKPEDVLKATFKLISKPKKKKIIINKFKIKSEVTIKEKILKRKILYAFSVFGRYELTKRCLESFGDSKYIKGKIIFANDHILDLRLEKLFLSFQDSTCLKIEQQVTSNIRSTHVLNSILKYIRNQKIEFDYFVMLDSDLLFKEYWIQRLIKLYETTNNEFKIWCSSGLNNEYNDKFNPSMLDSNIYESEFGKYRLRGNALQCIVIPRNIFDKELGVFDTTKYSSDLSKCEEFCKKGYKSLISVPSLVEHIGANYSMLRHSSGTYSKDFVDE